MKKVDISSYNGIQRFRFGYHPFGVPKLHVNVFWVDGLLIDTGQRRMRTSVLKTLKGLEVNQIFVTHHHEDHTGNLNQLVGYFKCPVWGSKRCAELMEKPPPISLPQWVFWGPNTSFKPIKFGTDYLETEQYRFEWIPISGHAEDMVALYEPNQGWLFSGDLFVYHYISYFLKEESMWTQIQSIKKVLTLDVEWFFCSHHSEFKLKKEELIRKLQYFETFFSRVALLSQRGYPAGKILEQMELRERWPIRIISNGRLSTINMVRSVLRDLHKGRSI